MTGGYLPVFRAIRRGPRCAVACFAVPRLTICRPRSSSPFAAGQGGDCRRQALARLTDSVILESLVQLCEKGTGVDAGPDRAVIRGFQSRARMLGVFSCCRAVLLQSLDHKHIHNACGTEDPRTKNPAALPGYRLVDRRGGCLCNFVVQVPRADRFLRECQRPEL